MQKPTSLAEFLGTEDAVDEPAGRSDETPSDAGPSLAERADRLTGKEFADAVLNSIEFRRYVVNKLVLGDIPAAVLCRVMDQGWGKPTEHLEVKDVTPQLKSLSNHDLDTLVQKVRTALLARMSDDDVNRSSADVSAPPEDPLPSSVH